MKNKLQWTVNRFYLTKHHSDLRINLLELSSKIIESWDIFISCRTSCNASNECMTPIPEDLNWQNENGVSDWNLLQQNAISSFFFLYFSHTKKWQTWYFDTSNIQWSPRKLARFSWSSSPNLELVVYNWLLSFDIRTRWRYKPI